MVHNSIGKDMEKLEPSYTADENAKECRVCVCVFCQPCLDGGRSEFGFNQNYFARHIQLNERRVRQLRIYSRD